ncbi:uncharacterized protein [Fopius arisanus]|uniref:Uncharacterized protein n=1 Tax=Fopius arisanus TaxID=64838 RepID=A0A0C9R212_9HYME|nr:PREDICTED: uncharacterized protein LOC105262735 [Fopius arisanus]
MSEDWNAVGKEQGEDDEEEEFLDDDIIDISKIDLEDEETWLVQAPTSEPSPCDLRTWLRNDFREKSGKSNHMINDNNDIGSPIDTRTFTRCKKRMGRLNFESMRQMPAVNSDNESSWSKMRINWKEEETRKEDSIPAMLRQSLSGLLIPGGSTQESLEAFLDMSQSKGIDSFINMVEPEFHESLMNISRPSFLQTTISNPSMHSSCGTSNPGMADSQILTESMMQTSMFSESDGGIDSISFSESSSRNWLDSSAATVLRDSSICDTDTTFTPSKFQTTATIIHNQEIITVNRTFDRLPSSNTTILSDTITFEDNPNNPRLNTTEVKNSNESFNSGTSFSQVALNSTFQKSVCEKVKEEEVEQGETSSNSTFKAPGCAKVKDDVNEPEEMSSNSTYVAGTNDEITFPSSEYSDEHLPNWPDGVAPSQDEEPKSLDMTYSTRDSAMLKESLNIIKNDDMPVNRYQTYRKSTAVSKTHLINKLVKPTGKTSLQYDENYRGKSMEMLNKMSGRTLDSQDIYTKLNGPKSLSRLPQTLQKSNPNLQSQSSTMTRGRSTRMIQSKFGFQPLGRGVMRNGQISTNRLNSLVKAQGEGDKTDTRNSSESIESTLSTYSGPDFDDGLSTCSDGSHPLNCEKSSDHLYKMTRIQVEKLNQESTPKADRRILENTWITSGKDLPSPILKNNEIPDKQINSNDTDAVIQTSSPLLSPAESLQSLPLTQENHLANEEKVTKQQESLPNKTSVLKQPQNLENKTDGVRLPVSRSSNLPSGIPRPASRIPAPKFSRANAQVKSQSNQKKSLF